MTIDFAALQTLASDYLADVKSAVDSVLSTEQTNAEVTTRLQAASALAATAQADVDAQVEA